MPLTPGTRLGPYEILSPLGAGGMGEVYRARDPRLGRDVAIKVLPEAHAADPEHRARFEREARAISKLAHPHICALFDVGQVAGSEYLVMELLEGETLAQRLERGGLPFDQVVRFGRQIASALAAAHAQGIIHRDLKPANVFLTVSGARLLDFGLARQYEPAGDARSAAAEATRPALALTDSGVISGTAPYMAPEQVEGHAIDARSDVFAFGAVLFEMATGARAFAGSSAAAVMAAILTHDPPPVSSLVPAVPRAFDRLVRRCLAKDPAERWRSARDLELQLLEITESVGAVTPSGAASAPTARARAWMPWAIAGAATVGLIAAIALLAPRGNRSAGPAVGGPVVRFAIAPPDSGEFGPQVESPWLAVSADGSMIAYLASDAHGSAGVWLRPLNSAEGHFLRGTEGAHTVFWAPDGRSIGFHADGQIKRIDLAGGGVTPICPVGTTSGIMASWGRAGEILFASTLGRSIFRVPADGGKPALVAVADSARGQWRLGWPCFLPDGHRFMFVAMRDDGLDSLMFQAPGGRAHGVMPLRSAVAFTNPDLLVFVREGALFGQRFDWQRGAVSGGPFPIAEPVHFFLSTGAAGFATSEGGTLVYEPASDVMRMTWFDRAGRNLGTVSTPGNYNDLTLSPDGRRLLFARTQPRIGTFDLWSMDLDRGSETRLTSHWNSEFSGMLLPDNRTMIFSSVAGGLPRLHRLDLSTGRIEALLAPTGFQWASDLSPDGSTLAYVERTPVGSHAWAIPVAGGGKPTALLPLDYNVYDPRFSPDGRAIAFLSDFSGQFEAYVAPYPGPGERIRISNGGALGLRWPRGGHDLVYLGADRRVMSVSVRTSPSISVGRPASLFTIQGRGSWRDFDVTADGSRVLAIVSDLSASEVPLQAIVNWPAAVRP
ncbi:MAG: protein kinase [Candidatus Eisenbacteria bacterium]